MTDPIAPPDIEIDPSRVMPAPTFKQHRQEFTEAELAPFLEGKMEIPNFEPVELWQAAAQLPSYYGGTHKGYARLPGDSRVPHQSFNRAFYLLHSGQFRGADGTGYVIITRGYNSGPERVVAGKFALCKHEHVEDPGANSHGWHPSHCKLCGLNTSVDSGD